MNSITQIIGSLGGTTVVAKGLKLPIMTVHSWIRRGNIPEWRRDAVKKLARRKRVDVDFGEKP